MGYFPYGINNYFFKSTDVGKNKKGLSIFSNFFLFLFYRQRGAIQLACPMYIYIQGIYCILLYGIYYNKALSSYIFVSYSWQNGKGATSTFGRGVQNIIL